MSSEDLKVLWILKPLHLSFELTVLRGDLGFSDLSGVSLMRQAAETGRLDALLAPDSIVALKPPRSRHELSFEMRVLRWKS